MARILFTSRHWGNFGDHVGEQGDLVAKRREQLAKSLATQKVFFMNQIHGDRAIEVDQESTGPWECDALITRTRGISLAVMTADCIPLILTSTEVVAAVHVGRAGLLAEIAPKVISQMRAMGATNISAFVGPSICAGCYEVSSEMYREISEAIPATATSSHSHSLNLVGGVREQIEKDVVVFNSVDICTKESPDYFSYRGESTTGRQIAVVSL